MEHALICNNLKCRKELGERALVTTCSHIFCLDCAHRLGITGNDAVRNASCPACSCQLPNPDDAVIANLNPSEDYKTSVLSGLSPNIIMECAGRALSFWAYQTTQDICYQQYLYKTLSDKYSALSLRMDKTVNDANSEIEGLRRRLEDLSSDQDALRRKNDELVQAFRDKSRRLLQTQELYDKVKRKAEMGQIQQAASEAVDTSIEEAAHLAQRNGEDYHAGDDHQSYAGNATQSFVHGLGFNTMGMNSGARRSFVGNDAESVQWPKHGTQPRSDMNNSAAGSTTRQRLDRHSMMNGSSYSAHGVGTPMPEPHRQGKDHGMTTPPFAHGRGAFSGLGLTSGLKVSQPSSVPSLGASIRGQ